jgi:hypothetical protein
VAGCHLALDAGGDVADTVEVGDRGAAEFHNNTRHGVGLSSKSGPVLCEPERRVT